jgi:ABC-type nitrate/sulfonate/bicarbonate transport system permease component
MAAGGTEGTGTALLRRVPGPAERDPRHHLLRRRRVERALAWGVPLVLLGAWQAAASSGAIDPRLFPAPSTIASTAWAMVRSGDLGEDVVATSRRLFLGLVLGVASGIALGFAMGLSRWLRAGLDPLLSALYVVPKLALFPVLLVVFGVGDTPTILLVAMTVFMVMAIATEAAVRSVPVSYREAAVSLGARRRQVLRHVLLPASLPQVLVALRLGVGLAVLVAIGAEFVHGDDGLGHLIWKSWALFSPARMYVGVLSVAVLGVVLALAVRVAGRLLTPWAGESTG